MSVRENVLPVSVALISDALEWIPNDVRIDYRFVINDS